MGLGLWAFWRSNGGHVCIQENIICKRRVCPTHHKGGELVPVTTGRIYRVGAPFTEQLNYSNPLGRPVQTIWYNYERYFIIDGDHEVFWTDPPDVPVKEYVFRHGDSGSPGEALRQQFPIYSLIPGSYHYQPIA